MVVDVLHRQALHQANAMQSNLHTISVILSALLSFSSSFNASLSDCSLLISSMRAVCFWTYSVRSAAGWVACSGKLCTCVCRIMERLYEPLSSFPRETFSFLMVDFASSSWARYSRTFTLSPFASSIFLRVTLSGYLRAVWSTGLQSKGTLPNYAVHLILTEATHGHASSSKFSHTLRCVSFLMKMISAGPKAHEQACAGSCRAQALSEELRTHSLHLLRRSRLSCSKRLTSISSLSMRSASSSRLVCAFGIMLPY
jgi:hypothetical protein